MKDWTMLVYVNGHNSLSSYGAENINQMETVGSTDHLNIAVEWGATGSPTQRLLVQKDNDPNVTSPILQSLPADLDMGDPANLVDFIKWGHDNFPAKHYFVVVWGHGSGWVNDDAFRPMDISFDENSGHWITTQQLAQAMAQAAQIVGQNIDIYGSDACLMAMVEVAHEMSASVNYSVGSEQTEAGDGWPYDTFLQAWAAQPNATAADISTMLVTAYGARYQGAGGATFSALDLSKLSALDQDLIAFKTEVMAHADLAAANQAAQTSTRFDIADYVDIGEVIKNVGKLLPSSSGAVTAQLGESLKSVVLASTGTGANGLSIWWPAQAASLSKDMALYQSMKFDQATKWSDLLGKLPLQ